MGRKEKEPKDERSATEKLFDSSNARQTGLSGRRRFIPPGKEGGENYGGDKGTQGGFNPGKAVVDQLKGGA